MVLLFVRRCRIIAIMGKFNLWYFRQTTTRIYIYILMDGAFRIKNNGLLLGTLSFTYFNVCRQVMQSCYF